MFHGALGRGGGRGCGRAAYAFAQSGQSVRSASGMAGQDVVRRRIPAGDRTYIPRRSGAASAVSDGRGKRSGGDGGNVARDCDTRDGDDRARLRRVGRDGLRIGLAREAEGRGMCELISIAAAAFFAVLFFTIVCHIGLCGKSRPFIFFLSSNQTAFLHAEGRARFFVHSLRKRQCNLFALFLNRK